LCEYIYPYKDDGIGMSECSLNKIIRGEIVSQKGSSFGLKNIHERILNFILVLDMVYPLKVT